MLLVPMTQADVDAVLDVQVPGSVRALAAVFPQDTHPFPREEVARRWREEIADPGIDCFAIRRSGSVAGFAAVRQDELLHFGTDVGTWGSGLAGQAHDEVLHLLRGRGVRTAWLRVFEANARARRFYERRGWEERSVRTRSTFAPHPVLVRYERSLAADHPDPDRA